MSIQRGASVTACLFSVQDTTTSPLFLVLLTLSKSHTAVAMKIAIVDLNAIMFVQASAIQVMKFMNYHVNFHVLSGVQMGIAVNVSAMKSVVAVKNLWKKSLRNANINNLYLALLIQKLSFVKWSAQNLSTVDTNVGENVEKYAQKNAIFLSRKSYLVVT